MNNEMSRFSTSPIWMTTQMNLYRIKKNWFCFEKYENYQINRVHLTSFPMGNRLFLGEQYLNAVINTDRRDYIQEDYRGSNCYPWISSNLTTTGLLQK